MTDYYHIWSNEHQGWWGVRRAGYTHRIEEAGRYTKSEAIAICADAIAGTKDRLGMLPELPVREEDVQGMFTEFKRLFPGYDPQPATAKAVK